MFFPGAEKGRKERHLMREEKERQKEGEYTKKTFLPTFDDVYAFCATNASRLDHKNSLPTRGRGKKRDLD
jgi:hypothetical protein